MLAECWLLITDKLQGVVFKFLASLVFNIFFRIIIIIIIIIIIVFLNYSKFQLDLSRIGK